jgi:hypothetical protein
MMNERKRLAREIKMQMSAHTGEESGAMGARESMSTNKGAARLPIVEAEIKRIEMIVQ